MSADSDPREQVDANAEQDLELKDLEVKNADMDTVRGGEATAPAPKPPQKAFELKDVSFDNSKLPFL